MSTWSGDVDLVRGGAEAAAVVVLLLLSEYCAPGGPNAGDLQLQAFQSLVPAGGGHSLRVTPLNSHRRLPAAIRALICAAEIRQSEPPDVTRSSSWLAVDTISPISREPPRL
jgi:hypothetical protein